MTEIYQSFQGFRYVGFYNFTRKGIVLRDTDLIRDILVKDFPSFHDNNFDISEEHDIIFGKNPFVLKGDRWKIVRAQITPSFTTGKVKAMMPLFIANNAKLLRYLQEKTTGNDKVLEAKELASKITCENVASCAFGLDGGCFLQEHSEFREMGRKLSHPSFANGLKRFCLFIVPSLSKILKVKFFFDEITDFLRKIVRETLSYRKENNINRNDFLDAMQDLHAKINNDQVFGEDDILAHAGGFFLDGFETSAVAISHVMYDIAANVQVQQKLRREINEVLGKHGSLTFEAIQDMQYLDCVIKESMRMHVALLTLGKLCNQTYKLPPAKENGTGPEVTLEPGTIVVVPTAGLQMDAKYFPEPEKFIPERFSDENKEKINRFAYLPFGEGPRKCLGSKFGSLQTKMSIIAIVHNFNLSVNEETPKFPWDLDGMGVMNVPLGGLWLNFDRITNKS